MHHYWTQSDHQSKQFSEADLDIAAEMMTDPQSKDIHNNGSHYRYWSYII